MERVPVTRSTVTDANGRSIDSVTIEWAELKTSMLDVFEGKNPPVSLGSSGYGHAARFREYLMDKADAGWRGYNPADCKRWLVSGYQLAGLEFANPPIPIREKRRLIYAEEGEEFHLDLAYDGEDACFSEWTTREVIPGLAVEAEISFSSMTNASVLTSYFQFLCRALYALEQAGIDLDVSLVNTVSGCYRSSCDYQQSKIRVKRENEASDFASWSAMLSPASLRSYGFCAKLISAEDAGQEADSWLGRPRESSWKITWNSSRSVIEISVQGNAARSFPEESMENQLRIALAEMHD